MRDATFWLDQPFTASDSGGCIVYEAVGLYLVAGIGKADAVPQSVMHYELRQALLPGVQLEAVCDVGGWFVSLTGYIFNVS